MLDRVFLVMMVGAELDSAILGPLGAELMRALGVVRDRDRSTALGRLYLALADCMGVGEVDLSGAGLVAPEQRGVVRAVEVFQKKWYYAPSYLKAWCQARPVAPPQRTQSR